MNIYLTILFITTLTGVGGLALGGCLAAAVHSPSDRAVSLLLRFTAGVMLSVVCFDLVGDAMEGGGALPVLCWPTTPTPTATPTAATGRTTPTGRMQTTPTAASA